MGRKRPERKNAKLIESILEAYQPETAQDIQEALKDLTANLLEEMLMAELE
ncbi:hypothetical protein CULT_1490011 [[Clostridium] ultunense Esp]|nr:hypothetical protein CULT_1490011 [[Clostridium] ultunense Esp]